MTPTDQRPTARRVVKRAMRLGSIPDFIPAIGLLDDLLVAGIAVWWFLGVCPPELALGEIEYLERTPLGPIGRALP